MHAKCVPKLTNLTHACQVCPKVNKKLKKKNSTIQKIDNFFSTNELKTPTDPSYW